MVTLGEQHENDPAPPEPFRLGYQRWLDGLRGLAILLVLALHLHLLPGGHLGVDIFFVLSGFLITTQLTEQWQQHGSINLSGFYYRRARRLLPAFLRCSCCVSSWTWARRPGSHDLAFARCWWPHAASVTGPHSITPACPAWGTPGHFA